MSDCDGRLFCNWARPVTGAEQRAYDETVRALGGPRSRAGRAFIEREHRRFVAALREHRRHCGAWFS